MNIEETKKLIEWYLANYAKQALSSSPSKEKKMVPDREGWWYRAVKVRRVEYDPRLEWGVPGFTDAVTDDGLWGGPCIREGEEK